MLRKFLSVAAAALLISVILLTPASSADTGEATLLSGTHRSWLVEIEDGLTLSYDIEAGTGALNVMVLSAANFTAYADGRPYLAVEGTEAWNATSVSKDILLDSGSYYVVVETTEAGGGATFTYRIDAVAPSAPSSSLVMVMGVGALALLAVVLYFFADLKAGRR